MDIIQYILIAFAGLILAGFSCLIIYAWILIAQDIYNNRDIKDE